MKKAEIVILIGISILLISSFSFQNVHAAYLSAYINPNNPTSNLEIKYLRIIFIEHEEGGEIVDMINSKFGSDSIQFSADSSDEGVMDLMNRINQKLLSDGSGSKISSLNVEYSVQLTERALNTAIDYKIILSGTLTNYIIREGDEQIPTLIDMGWRGITVEGPVVINGVEINMPISYLKERHPTVYSHIVGTQAETLLSDNLINAEGIKNLSLVHWHFLFDPTGVDVDKSQFGIDEKTSGFMVSNYVMGDGLMSRKAIEKEAEAHFTVDRDYVVRSLESADYANIAIIGFGAIDKLEDLEILGVTPKPPQGYATTSTGGFPVGIFYGMAAMVAMAAIGGIVIIPLIIAILWKKGIIFT